MTAALGAAALVAGAGACVPDEPTTCRSGASALRSRYRPVVTQFVAQLRTQWVGGMARAARSRSAAWTLPLPLRVPRTSGRI
jgi:hypothetical protein